jgi:hypothetical protein
VNSVIPEPRPAASHVSMQSGTALWRQTSIALQQTSAAR